jgi:hypothetical protein
MVRSICCQKIWSVSVTAQFPRSGHLPYESSLLGLKPWNVSFAKNRFAVCMNACLASWPSKASQSIPAFSHERWRISLSLRLHVFVSDRGEPYPSLVQAPRAFGLITFRQRKTEFRSLRTAI